MPVRAKGWLWFSWVLLLPCFPISAAESASELLDKIFNQPGHWSQMCASPPPLPYDMPLPLYSLATPRFFSLSQENVAKLKARRAEVSVELAKRLDRIVIQGFPKQEKPYNARPPAKNELSGLLLEIILEIDAVDTLPGLLRLEATINDRLEKAAKDNGASLPDLDLDSPTRIEVPPAPPGLTSKVEIEIVSKLPDISVQQQRTFAARLYQRELLSVIAELLRSEHFKPLLDSDLEKNYQAYLKRHPDAGKLLPIWAPRSNSSGTVPEGFMLYTPRLREEIRGFGKSYLKEEQAASAK